MFFAQGNLNANILNFDYIKGNSLNRFQIPLGIVDTGFWTTGHNTCVFYLANNTFVENILFWNLLGKLRNSNWRYYTAREIVSLEC